MSTVANLYRLTGSSLPSGALTSLYVATRSPELLESFRAVGDWGRFSIWDKCAPLEAGIHEVEPGLLRHLVTTWERQNADRQTVAEALGQAGSADSLEYLRVIEFRLAEGVRTESLRLNREKPNLIEALSHQGDIQFLDAVKLAISKLRSRVEAQGG